MHDEVVLQDPRLLPGRPIRMADGRSWTIPLPSKELDAVLDDAPIGQEATFRRDYFATVEAVLEAEDEGERRRAELALAICLLGRNYKLSPAGFQVILETAPGDPTAMGMADAFRRIGQEHTRSLRLRAGKGFNPPRQTEVPNLSLRHAGLSGLRRFTHPLGLRNAPPLP